MFGFINIYKEKGMTSHDVVACLRRITGIRRIGHAGTLDPAAQGVLPVAIGNAARLIEYLTDEKAYIAKLHLGATSTTCDIEGEIVEKIHSAYNNCDGIIINPGAYTHTSVAIRDAIAAVNIPAVEIHITNIHGREDFRHKSLIANVCTGQISGFGTNGYKLGLKGLVDMLLKDVNP